MMASDEWTESGRDTSGVGRLGYDDTAPSELPVVDNFIVRVFSTMTPLAKKINNEVTSIL